MRAVTRITGQDRGPAMTAAPHRGRRLLRRACACLGVVLALVVASGVAAPALVTLADAPVEGTARPATARPAPAPGISVSGNRLLRDGEPFLPRGFNMIGLLTPDWCDRAPGIAAREHFDRPELAAARGWHADTLRFQVSQRGLADPAIPAPARQAYAQRVVDGVALARSAGFVVVVSMQDQFYGCGAVHPLPSRQTLDAWSRLAAALRADPYVLLELFNEPRNEADAAGWAQWRDGGSTPSANLGDPAVGHQALVDHLRSLGSTNVLVADAARLGERTTGMPRLADPTGNLAYGIHPYFFTNGPAWWDLHYAAAAADVPMIATEWNYRADGCGTAQERLAPALLDHLRRHSIGVLGHAFDVPGTTVADWTWRPTACGTPSGGAGLALQTFFAGLAARDRPQGQNGHFGPCHRTGAAAR
jgi:Cellulase (glycosyl hydrolase family 5)